MEAVVCCPESCHAWILQLVERVDEVYVEKHHQYAGQTRRQSKPNTAKLNPKMIAAENQTVAQHVPL
jgi:hypothetical protein